MNGLTNDILLKLSQDVITDKRIFKETKLKLDTENTM